MGYALTHATDEAGGRPDLLTAVSLLRDRVEVLQDRDLATSSRRPGWSTKHLLASALVDLQRLLRDLMMASSVLVIHQRERCSYDPHHPDHRIGPAPGDHDGFVRALSSAYPAGVLREEVTATADAVCIAVAELAAGSVAVGGTRVCIADFMVAWSQVIAASVEDLPDVLR